ncbi:Cytochrome P450 [Dillenia turbinata]|uniref:Cytochrome P450 n=1 Tax=Dillenia turbinata TaxID=194707 RepID=A0AAN8UMA6_9MAGN
METLFSLLTPQECSSIIRLVMLLYLFLLISHNFRQFHKFSGNGPKTYPFIGCLISFYRNRGRLLDWYTEMLASSTSQTIVIHRLGAPRTVVTANPENVEYMLRINFDNFPKGKPFTQILGDFLGRGIFNVDGELWRTQRKLVSHEFSARSVKELVLNALHEEVEKRLLPILDNAAKDREEIDLQEVLRRLAFDLVCKVSLGIDLCCLDPSRPISHLLSAFDKASEICARRGAASVFLIWKLKRLFGVGSEKELKQAVGEIHKFVAEIIHKRKMKLIEQKESENENDLLSRLISAGHEDEFIRDMIISFIMAGRDTTSAAMTWLFWLLSRHPKIEQELAQEAGDGIEKNSLQCYDYESLKEMRLLEACLCESMRLYPPISWDSKHAIEDDILPDGTLVRRGDRVTYFPYGMGRLEALWGKDRFEFKPDRWFIEPDKEVGQLKKVCPYKYPIFQAGPRVCIGKDMAFIQMKYVAASILSKFEIRPVNPNQPIFVPLLTAHMAGGLRVLVRRRDRKTSSSEPNQVTNLASQ